MGVRERDRERQRDRERERETEDLPRQVLVDEGTMSAAEVLAGALQVGGGGRRREGWDGAGEKR